MKFADVAEKLREGKKITRSVWSGQIFFAYKDGDIKAWQPGIEYFMYDENIMLTDDWAVCEYPAVILNFYEIMPALKDGKNLKRKSWDDDTYIYLDTTSERLILHTNRIFNFIPTFADFNANDWIVV
jgi:hypothetical protein